MDIRGRIRLCHEQAVRLREQELGGQGARKEIPSFVAARLFSLGVEELGLIIFVNFLHFDSKVFHIPLINFDLSGEMTAKIILAVVVVILNYFFSKLIIFKKKKAPEQEKAE